MMNFRRMLRGLTVFGSLAAMAQANTISYYVELFVPGETTNNLSGQNLSGAFTNAQLLGFASGVALHDASVEGFSGTVTLPQFNQLTAPGVGANQMGVLSSVQMVIAWAAKGTIEVLNYNAAGISFSSANSIVPMDVDGPGSLDINGIMAAAGPYSGANAAATVVANFSLTAIYNAAGGGTLGNSIAAGVCSHALGTYNSATHNCANYHAPTLQTVGGVTTYTGINSGVTLTSGLNSFYGMSTFDSSVLSSNGNYGGTAPSHVDFGGLATAGLLAEVVYNYDVVNTPEPVTMGLVGSALIGVALIRRRNRKA